MAYAPLAFPAYTPNEKEKKLCEYILTSKHDGGQILVNWQDETRRRKGNIPLMNTEDS